MPCLDTAPFFKILWPKTIPYSDINPYPDTTPYSNTTPFLHKTLCPVKTPRPDTTPCTNQILLLEPYFLSNNPQSKHKTNNYTHLFI